MNKTVLTFSLGMFLSFFSLSGVSQTRIIDSLVSRLSKNLQDTDRVSTLNTLAWKLGNNNPDTAISLSRQALKIAENKRFDLGKGRAHHQLGWFNYLIGDYSAAMENYSRALEIWEKIELAASYSQSVITVRKAATFSNIGIVYKEQADYSEALNYYFKALRLNEQVGNKKFQSANYSNIGAVYSGMSDYDKALQYYFKALKLKEELGDKHGLAICLGNIGVAYNLKNEWKEAKEYLVRALGIAEELGDIHEEARFLGNLGSVYDSQADQPNVNSDLLRKDALEYYIKAIALSQKIGNMHYLAANLGNVGVVYMNLAASQKNKTHREAQFNKAVEYLEKSSAFARKIGALDYIRNNELSLAQLYDTIGIYKSAFKHYKNYIAARDSITNEENTKMQVQQEMQYEFDKKEAVAKAEQEKKDALAREELEKQKMQRNGFIGGFALMLGLAGVSYRSYRNKQKANKVISKQKEEVQKQKEIVELQKHLVEEKNQEILDSITYAKRLQEAILPPAKLVKEKLPRSFVLYKPKDIVAGDFYWLEVVGKALEPTVLFAAADCTGHGVPGAMVSVVCSNALNRAVKEFGITDPGKILDKVRELVIETFEKSESEVKDGMDISLVSLKVDVQGLQSGVLPEVKWAGANNPLWIVRSVIANEVKQSHNIDNKLIGQTEPVEVKPDSSAETPISKNNYELIEVKADKQPIGKYADQKPFTTHTIDLLKGDTLYIFTDGYADQFGGESGKKLKSANFKKLLLSIQHENIETQKQFINDAFENWKGSLEQVDDVTVIGIKTE